MNRIIDFEKFKEECTKYDRQALKSLLFGWAFQRTLLELAIVEAINTCRHNGEIIPKAESIEDLGNSVEGERILINLLGRKEAAKVYGNFEGITSDIKTVDWVLSTDFVGHYKEVFALNCVDESKL